MPLDPQAVAVLEMMSEMELDITQQSPEEARAGMNMPPDPDTLPDVGQVENREIPGPAVDIPIRIYTPDTAEKSGPFPLLVFYHGGGFVVGDLESHDVLCRSLCMDGGAVVVAVDYRLAPEHTFPAAPEDCYAATVWAQQHASELNARGDALVVGGDSAGGNLAAVVALMARDRGGPAICHQLLIYPVTDHSFVTASYKENAEGYFLTTAMMEWFWDHYLAQEGDSANIYASPLRAESLTGLPEATVITAEYDPLRDEGEAYAQRLLEAGVKTELVRFNGMIHGFVSMPLGLDQQQAGVALLARKLAAL